MNDRQSQIVLYDLRSRIVSGVLRAGEKLRASHLAQTMEASRTPISEALIKLESEGLLVRDKSGFTVRSFNLEDVRDAIDLRGLLEAGAVQRAAEQGVDKKTLEQLKSLLSTMDALIERGDYLDYDQANEQFHTTLVDACQSPILIEEVRRSYRFPFAGPSAFPTRGSQRFNASIHRGHDQHHQMVEALEKRQSARLFALMREHAGLAHLNVEEAVRNRQAIPQLALVAS